MRVTQVETGEVAGCGGGRCSGGESQEDGGEGKLHRGISRKGGIFLFFDEGWKAAGLGTDIKSVYGRTKKDCRIEY